MTGVLGVCLIGRWAGRGVAWTLAGALDTVLLHRNASGGPVVARPSPSPAPAATADAAEVARFEALAAHWWDPKGPHGPLHRLNPARLGYVRDALAPLADGRDGSPLRGLAVIDVGCGGGLVSEPLARLGAHVTGLDAGAEAIAVARVHAAEQDLAIDYRVGTAEDMVETGARFDAVVALEIVEHVPDLDRFLAACVALTRPEGRIVLSTLNRTARSFALAIVGAERVLRWLPSGTHDWRKFPRPAELARSLRATGARVTDVTGLAYDPSHDAWRLSRDTAVNYLATAVV
ncbi:MAG: bifunctional 2-polyprenyl-6-hydroxyphenol methylase/3-demethylubiquinol 3-O-methyltransferase UbiG [Alphaproteobacteria bacterium]|nr:bifunctional 2-polyprenyl-6-hydroxyphenol methylase/3-demethylubiquinol 3-O-methyltransferase UbiG [Alphaproteobacteria bacterium]